MGGGWYDCVLVGGGAGEWHRRAAAHGLWWQLHRSSEWGGGCEPAAWHPSMQVRSGKTFLDHPTPLTCPQLTPKLLPVQVKSGKTFLDLIAEQVKHTRQKYSACGGGVGFGVG